MRGHLGAVLTSGLAAVALALALLQAIVLAHGAPRYPEVTAARSGTSNRYSVPGGRSGIPFIPFDKARPPDQGQTPQRQHIIVGCAGHPIDRHVDPVGARLYGDADKVRIAHRFGLERLPVGIGNQASAEAGLLRESLRNASGPARWSGGGYDGRTGGS